MANYLGFVKESTGQIHLQLLGLEQITTTKASRMSKTTPKSSKPGPRTSSKAAAPKAKAAPAKKAASAPASQLATEANPKMSPAARSAISAAPKPVVVTPTVPSVSAPDMKKKELIDIVTERSGIKKKDAKPVIEAMLAVLGQAISDGRELNLQPLGKAKINRQKAVQGGKVTILKLRQSDRMNAPKDPLAKAAE